MHFKENVSINVNKLLAVLLLPVYFLISHLYTQVVAIYFSLFVDHVNKPIIIVFGAFYLLF